MHPGLRGALPRRRGRRTAGWSRDYLCRVIAAKVRGGEPALVYGHPERRLGRMPEILIALHRLLERQSLVWRATLTELARWWRWRASRKYLVLPRDGNRFEIQFDEWDPEYPLAMEIHRGDFSLLAAPLRAQDCGPGSTSWSTSGASRPATACSSSDGRRPACRA